MSIEPKQASDERITDDLRLLRDLANTEDDIVKLGMNVAIQSIEQHIAYLTNQVREARDIIGWSAPTESTRARARQFLNETEGI